MEILPFSAMHLTHNYPGPCDNNFRMASLLIVSSAMPRSAARSIGMLSMGSRDRRATDSCIQIRFTLFPAVPKNRKLQLLHQTPSSQSKALERELSGKVLSAVSAHSWPRGTRALTDPTTVHQGPRSVFLTTTKDSFIGIRPF